MNKTNRNLMMKIRNAALAVLCVASLLQVYLSVVYIGHRNEIARHIEILISEYNANEIEYNAIHEIIVTPTRIHYYSIAKFVFAAFGTLLLLFAAFDIIEWIFLQVLRIGKEKSTKDKDMDSVIATKLLLHAVAYVVPLLVLVVILGRPQGSVEKFIILMRIVITIFTVYMVIIYWIEYRRYSISRPESAQIVAENLGDPRKRVKIWINGVSLLVLLIIVFEVYIPWLSEKAQTIGADSSKIVMIEYKHNGIDEVISIIEQAALLNDSAPLDGTERIEIEKYLLELAYENHMELGGIPSTQMDMLRANMFSLTALVTIWVFAGIIVAPFFIRPKGSIEWREYLKEYGRMKWLAVSGFLMLLIGYLLDWMGITSSKPLLWLCVFTPLVIADVFASTKRQGEKVIVVIGGGSYHHNKECGALRSTDNNRIRQIDKATAKRIGYVRCKRCGN